MNILKILYSAAFFLALSVQAATPKKIPVKNKAKAPVEAVAQTAQFETKQRIYVLNGRAKVTQKGFLLKGSRMALKKYTDGSYFVKSFSTELVKRLPKKVRTGKDLLDYSGLKYPKKEQYLEQKAVKTRLGYFRQTNPETGITTEGYAQLMDYDSTSEVVTMFGNALLQRHKGGQMTEVATGFSIVYNRKTDLFTIQKGQHKNMDNRIKITIEAK